MVKLKKRNNLLALQKSLKKNKKLKPKKNQNKKNSKKKLKKIKLQKIRSISSEHCEDQKG